MTLRYNALISVTVLGFALIASAPAWAATKHEPELRTAASPKKKPVATEKTAAKKTETTKGSKKSTDDAKTVKAKTETTGKGKKTTEVANKTPAKGKKKTELADDTSAKGKKKTTDVADAKTSKKTGARTSSKSNSRTEVAEACGTKAKLKTKKCKAAQLAAKADKKKADKELIAKLAAVKPITFLPAPFFPKQEAPVVPVNNGPVPYNAVAGQGTPIAPSPLSNALSPADAALYHTAFDLMDKSDYAGADAQLAQVTDKSLIGYAQYHKLFSAGYQSTYEELTAWLTAYGDLPMAMKVWGLAKRKKPEGAPDPAFPLLAANATAQRSDALTGGAGIQLAGMTSLSDSTTVSRPDAAAHRRARRRRRGAGAGVAADAEIGALGL